MQSSLRDKGEIPPTPTKRSNKSILKGGERESKRQQHLSKPQENTLNKQTRQTTSRKHTGGGKKKGEKTNRRDVMRLIHEERKRCFTISSRKIKNPFQSKSNDLIADLTCPALEFPYSSPHAMENNSEKRRNSTIRKVPPAAAFFVSSN